MPGFSDPSELFDVVDAQDRVVGQASRREVHARGLLHRAVHVLVHNRAGEVFLQRRSPQKDTFPDRWDNSCTGHLDAGEDYAAAARRELAEELGWHDLSLVLRPVTKLSASAQTGWEFIEIYLMGPCDGPFALNAEEITAGRWISAQGLRTEIQQVPDEFTDAVHQLWAEHGRKLALLLSSQELSKL